MHWICINIIIMFESKLSGNPSGNYQLFKADPQVADSQVAGVQVAGVHGYPQTSNILRKRLPRKLHIIIVLHFGLVTFLFHVGKLSFLFFCFLGPLHSAILTKCDVVRQRNLIPRHDSWTNCLQFQCCCK